MSKIDTLTEEQNALFPKYIDKWTKIGLCTKPANRSKAENLINEVYKVAGLKAPSYIIWCGSPLAAIYTAKITHQLLNDKEFVKKLLKETNGKKKPKNIGASVGASVWDSVGASVWDSVGDSVYSEAGFGQQDAAWLGFYQYFGEVLKLSKQVEKLLPLTALAEECNWFYPYKNFCFVSDKPEICSLKNNRIHSEAGPSIKYRDGFSVYALNGVRMPEWILNQPKENLKAEDILKLDNAEQRMQAMKHKGLGHFFSELKTTLLDKKDGYELLMIDHDGELCEYLKMVNPSTGEIHLEGILPGLKTVDAARAWRNGLEYWINPLALT